MGPQAQDKKEFLIFLNKVPRGCITPSSELPVAGEGESADNHLRGGLSFIGSKLGGPVLMKSTGPLALSVCVVKNELDPGGVVQYSWSACYVRMY